VAPTAAYDEIADWYEDEFLAASAGRDPIGVKAALSDLLGLGGGLCLEIGCGTGTHAGQVRDLGWTPVGVDLSAAMLRRAAGRLPIARADAARLPIRDASVPAVIVRHKVGAVHRPLPELLHLFLDAGLTFERFSEGGAPTPAVLAARLRKR
jgi:ubiquinone/menaquinone biosynthesis C-methylase UbiE